MFRIKVQDNNNNNIYLLQLGCYPVAVVILHVNMKLVTTKFKSGGLHEKHVVAQILVILKHFIRTSEKRHCFFVTKTSRLILPTKTTAVFVTLTQKTCDRLLRHDTERCTYTDHCACV